jgi:hypothetical protein
MGPPRDPELDVAARAMVGAGASFVVIGGFAVIANRFVRATEDVDFLIPDDDTNDRRVLTALRALGAVRQRDQAPLRDEYLLGQEHLRVIGDAGMIDIIRGGVPPLDFGTVASEAMRADYDDVVFPIASLRSIVGFKRLAGRPQDLQDLERLAEIHGSLPEDPIPGLDS